MHYSFVLQCKEENEVPYGRKIASRRKINTIWAPGFVEWRWFGRWTSTDCKIRSWIVIQPDQYGSVHLAILPGRRCDGTLPKTGQRSQRGLHGVTQSLRRRLRRAPLFEGGLGHNRARIWGSVLKKGENCRKSLKAYKGYQYHFDVLL